MTCQSDKKKNCRHKAHVSEGVGKLPTPMVSYPSAFAGLIILLCSLKTKGQVHSFWQQYHGKNYWCHSESLKSAKAHKECTARGQACNLLGPPSTMNKDIVMVGCSRAQQGPNQKHRIVQANILISVLNAKINLGLMVRISD